MASNMRSRTPHADVAMSAEIAATTRTAQSVRRVAVPALLAGFLESPGMYWPLSMVTWSLPRTDIVRQDKWSSGYNFRLAIGYRVHGPVPIDAAGPQVTATRPNRPHRRCGKRRIKPDAPCRRPPNTKNPLFYRLTRDSNPRPELLVSEALARYGGFSQTGSAPV